MQIQKRVVTINIINDSKEIKQLAEPILTSLESGLKKMNYILSAVHFKQPGNVQQLIKSSLTQSKTLRIKGLISGYEQFKKNSGCTSVRAR